MTTPSPHLRTLGLPTVRTRKIVHATEQANGDRSAIPPRVVNHCEDYSGAIFSLRGHVHELTKHYDTGSFSVLNRTWCIKATYGDLPQAPSIALAICGRTPLALVLLREKVGSHPKDGLVNVRVTG